MDPISAMAIGGIGSALLGGLFGSSNQSSANRTNIQIMREQNEWNLAQWHRENEYNAPIAQMERLKDAGINPNLAFSNGSTMSNISAHSPQAVSPPTIRPYMGWSQDINNAVQNVIQMIASKDAHEMNKIQMDSERIRQMTENAKRLEIIARESGLKLDNELKQRTMQDLVKYHANQSILSGKQIQLSEAQYYSEIMRQSLIEADAIHLAKQIKKVEEETRTQHWKTQNEKIAYAISRYEHELNKKGFSSKDPLYANLIRTMAEDPVYARTLILGLEGLSGASSLLKSFMGTESVTSRDGNNKSTTTKKIFNVPRVKL